MDHWVQRTFGNVSFDPDFSAWIIRPWITMFDNNKLYATALNNSHLIQFLKGHCRPVALCYFFYLFTVYLTGNELPMTGFEPRISCGEITKINYP